MHPEASRKASLHSESGGQTSPAPSTKAIAHPYWGPWGILAPWPSGQYFWAGLGPQLPAGTSRPLTKPYPIPSPADELLPMVTIRVIELPTDPSHWALNDGNQSWLVWVVRHSHSLREVRGSSPALVWSHHFGQHFTPYGPTRCERGLVWVVVRA